VFLEITQTVINAVVVKIITDNAQVRLSCNVILHVKFAQTINVEETQPT